MNKNCENKERKTENNRVRNTEETKFHPLTRGYSNKTHKTKEGISITAPRFTWRTPILGHYPSTIAQLF